jgi:hypothetical protein
MPTPATSIRFRIYGQGEEPRIVTVFNPAQNIIYSDIVNNGLEAAIGIANLPDSPLRIDFPSSIECYGFVTTLRQGLYDFNPAAANTGWPNWVSGGGVAGDPLELTNLTAIEQTTTAAPGTTTTTTAAQYDATISWSFTQYASGTFKIWVNGTAVVNANVDDSGILYVSAGDEFYSEILGPGTTTNSITSINWLNTPTTVYNIAGNIQSATYTIALGENWVVNGYSELT